MVGSFGNRGLFLALKKKKTLHSANHTPDKSSSMNELERWMGENVLQEKDFEYVKDFVCQGSGWGDSIYNVQF